MAAKDHKATLSADAKMKLTELVTTDFNNRDEFFGNAGDMRTMVEQTRKHMYNRVPDPAPDTPTFKAMLATILPDDIQPLKRIANANRSKADDGHTRHRLRATDK